MSCPVLQLNRLLFCAPFPASLSLTYCSAHLLEGCAGRATKPSARRSVAVRAAVASPAARSPAQTGSVKSPMTMTEKILAKKSDNASVRPGDNIWTKVDKLMTHDVCGPGTFGIFQKEFGPNAQARRPLPAALVLPVLHVLSCTHDAVERQADGNGLALMSIDTLSIQSQGTRRIACSTCNDATMDTQHARGTNRTTAFPNHHLRSPQQRTHQDAPAAMHHTSTALQPTTTIS